MFRTSLQNLSEFELGSCYRSMEPDLIDLVDGAIRGKSAKIATIKFLRKRFNITLSNAKSLYEAREDWLGQTNPFCF